MSQLWQSLFEIFVSLASGVASLEMNLQMPVPPLSHNLMLGQTSYTIHLTKDTMGDAAN